MDYKLTYLVGGVVNFFIFHSAGKFIIRTFIFWNIWIMTFHSVGNVISSQLTNSYSSEGLISPTSIYSTPKY